jgi:transposase InsO family protein
MKVGVSTRSGCYENSRTVMLESGSGLRSKSPELVRQELWGLLLAHYSIRGLVHHSDRGVQYTSIRYAERLSAERAVRSVGSKGDSYDNAAAESLNSLYKRELIDPKEDWVGVDDVMLATMDWVQ